MKKLLFVQTSLLAWAVMLAPVAPAQTSSAAVATTGTSQPDGASSQLEEVVVTAQKRSQNINNIGMSIQSFKGDDLKERGITDTAQLASVVPGFNFTPTEYGTPVYTIRGVGYQETSLAASPTVSVYLDEFPLPYSIMTKGAGLDIERVEVLKGPQGTLFGENATGGAINYIANKPTATYSAGSSISLGRFADADIQGYVSGPITDTLAFRVALRTEQSDDWQRSYTHNATSGAANFSNGRVSFLWKPNDDLQAQFTLSGWLDRSDDQQAQLFGVVGVKATGAAVDPRLVNYPLAPHNDRAADWSACVNTSPFDPPFNTIKPPYGQSPPRPVSPTSCTNYQRNNWFLSAAAHLDYDLGNDLTLTSLTEVERFNRYQPIDDDGTIYQDYETLQQGHISTAYQELRLSGKILGRGSWIVGANTQRDSSVDTFLESFGDSSSTPLLGHYLGPALASNRQRTNTNSVFGDIEYPILPQLTAHAGIRYTQSDKRFAGCAYDSGDGSLSSVTELIQTVSAVLGGYPLGHAIPLPPGACVTLGPPPTFNPPPIYALKLDEHNASWRVGLDYKVVPGTMLYVNISQGYKAGSFPTISATTFAQLAPAHQEELRSYEVGFKSRLFHGTLQLNGAGFYYDYTNKQITGEAITLFGPLPLLVNVPKSDVAGFEFTATWEPIAGLTLSPGVSYSKSEVRGDYYNFDAFGQFANFKGQPFPDAPPLTGDVDVQYQWPVRGDIHAFVGGNLSYQDGTRSFFVDQQSTTHSPDLLDIPRRALLDLRAGVTNGTWLVELWGRNVTDEYYWTNARQISDVLVRFAGYPATYGVLASMKF